MQIVIDISDIKYQWIKENPLTYDNEYCEAIRNGTPLPKGHGRLIDADKLIEEFEEVCAGECGCCGRVNNCPVFTQQTVIKH